MPIPAPKPPIRPNRRRPSGVWRWIHPRVASASLVAGAWTLLATGLSMEAAPLGVGTHQQLGLPPCGFLVETGLPCATCGMTTAFTYAVHGRLMSAFLAQPAGLAVALLAAAAAVTGVYAFARAIPLAPLVRWLWQPRTVWSAVVLVMGSWLYKSLVILSGEGP